MSMFTDKRVFIPRLLGRRRMALMIVEWCRVDDPFIPAMLRLVQSGYRAKLPWFSTERSVVVECRLHAKILMFASAYGDRSVVLGAADSCNCILALI